MTCHVIFQKYTEILVVAVYENVQLSSEARHRGNKGWETFLCWTDAWKGKRWRQIYFVHHPFPINEEPMAKPLFFISGLEVNGEILSITEIWRNGGCILLAQTKPITSGDHWKLKVIPEIASPLNIPQLRTIEKNKANLKGRICTNDFVAKTDDQLIVKVTREQKNMPIFIFYSTPAKIPVNWGRLLRPNFRRKLKKHKIGGKVLTGRTGTQPNWLKSNIRRCSKQKYILFQSPYHIWNTFVIRSFIRI